MMGKLAEGTLEGGTKSLCNLFRRGVGVELQGKIVMGVVIPHRPNGGRVPNQGENGGPYCQPHDTGGVERKARLISMQPCGFDWRSKNAGGGVSKQRNVSLKTRELECDAQPRRRARKVAGFPFGF